MEILGVRIDNLTIEEALKKTEDFLEDGRQHYIVTPNPEFLIRAQKDGEFRKILNQADLTVPDGIGLIFASWFLGRPLKQRITGVDLMERICQMAAIKKWSVCLYGAKSGIAEEAAKNLVRRYQGLEIQSQNPKILFAALGAGKQEKWIVQNLKKMPTVKLAMGVGGAFDFISGRVKRAPKILRSLGLEWFWRLMVQPWRIKRIFKAVIVFPLLVIQSKWTSQR